MAEQMCERRRPSNAIESARAMSAQEPSPAITTDLRASFSGLINETNSIALIDESAPEPSDGVVGVAVACGTVPNPFVLDDDGDVWQTGTVSVSRSIVGSGIDVGARATDGVDVGSGVGVAL